VRAWNPSEAAAPTGSGGTHGTNQENDRVRPTDSRLVGARMAEHRGIGYTFVRCHLGLAILTEMSFRGEYLDHLNLTEANLAGCDFTDAVFDGCRIAGAELRAATFTRADLRGADLGQMTPADHGHSELVQSHRSAEPQRIAPRTTSTATSR
jgi:uncharacterized protein YjbI with pentapeptide repeats